MGDKKVLLATRATLTQAGASASNTFCHPRYSLWTIESVLETSWAIYFRFEASWKRFGNVLGDLPSVLRRLGPSWKRLGSVLWHLGTITNKHTCIENPFSPQDCSTSSCTELPPQDLVGRLGSPTSIILGSGGRVLGSEEQADPLGGEFAVRRAAPTQTVPIPLFK